MGRDLVSGLVAAQKLTWEHGKGPGDGTGGSTEDNVGSGLVPALVAAQKVMWEGTCDGTGGSTEANMGTWEGTW